MKTKLTLGLLSLTAIVFSGCVGQPSITKITEEEAFKYEKAYLNEYNQIKSQSNEIKSSGLWIQPLNKKSECKIYIENQSNSKYYWDGDCKEGFAYGLGRQFEIGKNSDIEIIGIYNGNNSYPEFYIKNNNLKNEISQGDILNGYYVKTYITDDNFNFDVLYTYGYFSKDIRKKPGLFASVSPLGKYKPYFLKVYPNFSYKFNEYQNGRFGHTFQILDKNKMANSILYDVNGIGVIMSNNKPIKRIILPENYYAHSFKIFEEIKNATQIAIQSQRKALLVNKEYKSKVCNNNKNVDFMSNQKYKFICDEDKRIEKLKELLAINKSKLEEEKKYLDSVSLKQMQIKIEQEKVSAMKRANEQRSWDSINQSIQNMNTNMQMQQLNNNLMMYNLMPKTHNVYIH